MLKGSASKLDIRIPSFVLDLYKILLEEKYSDMIAWELSGSRFIIKNPSLFASKVLPQYYKTNKFASFARQLNIYGFHRVSDRRRTKQNHTASIIIYSHQYFKRSQPNSLHLIQRTTSSYIKTRVKYSTPEVDTTSKSASAPSPPLSPVFPSFSVINTQLIPGNESRVPSIAEPIGHCSNCKTLEQEMATLSNMIQYYISVLNGSENATVIHTPVSTNYQNMWPMEIQPSLILSPSSTNFSIEELLPSSCIDFDFVPCNYTPFTNDRYTTAFKY
ncbi:hypothetical protein K7432_006464 [Basidiobolus ranarum]|uniref:HSF-type DNA-binding domain-containing protein n=1 Tax=Basidiobolus ranarum TaxID=34480 RepID=A0ABR2WV16_9FUNG